MNAPATLAGITPAWLTHVLREAGVLDGSAVRAVGIEPLATGQGITGQLARLCLEYDSPAPGAPLSVIAKLPHPDPGARANLNALGFYEREATFYRLFAGKTGVRIPGCYFSTYDPAAGASLLLLEDLERLCVGRTRLGSTPAEAELAIGEIASLHAAWWGRPELAELGWLFRWDTPPWSEPPHPYSDIWQRLRRHLGDSLPAAILPIGERLLRSLPFLHTQLARPPFTIIHNDYQMDNLFFDESNGGMELVVSDWQMVGRGRGPYDVALFLSHNVSTADRRAHEEAWLALYHRRLLDGGVRDYSFEQCLYDYRIGLMSVLGRFFVFVGSPQITSDAHIRDSLDVIVRQATAVVDQDAGSLLPAENAPKHTFL